MFKVKPEDNRVGEDICKVSKQTVKASIPVLAQAIQIRPQQANGTEEHRQRDSIIIPNHVTYVSLSASPRWQQVVPFQ